MKITVDPNIVPAEWMRNPHVSSVVLLFAIMTAVETVMIIKQNVLLKAIMKTIPLMNLFRTNFIPM